MKGGTRQRAFAASSGMLFARPLPTVEATNHADPSPTRDTPALLAQRPCPDRLPRWHRGRPGHTTLLAATARAQHRRPQDVARRFGARRPRALRAMRAAARGAAWR